MEPTFWSRTSAGRVFVHLEPAFSRKSVGRLVFFEQKSQRFGEKGETNLGETDLFGDPQPGVPKKLTVKRLDGRGGSVWGGGRVWGNFLGRLTQGERKVP